VATETTYICINNSCRFEKASLTSKHVVCDDAEILAIVNSLMSITGDEMISVSCFVMILQEQGLLVSLISQWSNT
jgi:hypothetical protein